VELLRGERADAGLIRGREEDVLVDEHRVEVGNGTGATVADLAGFLAVTDDAGDQRHRGHELTVRLAGPLGEGGPDDRRAAGDVTDQPPEVGVRLKERHRDVDDAVQLAERGEILLGYGPQRGDQFVAASGERLAQQILLVLEEQVNSRCGESGLERDLAQGTGVYSVLAEHLLGGVENLGPVLRPAGGTPPGTEIRLCLCTGRTLVG
jgi:hypothetical protein